MTEKKDKDRRQDRPKDRPKTERPPETARRRKGDDSRAQTDAQADPGRERATERGDRDFNPNVNQRPPR